MEVSKAQQADKMIEGQAQALEFLERTDKPEQTATKSALTQCAQCHKVYPLTLRHRHIADDVIEYGSTCQHCEHWHSAGFFNQRLIDWQRQGFSNRRQRRAFRREFEKLQKRVMENVTDV